MWSMTKGQAAFLYVCLVTGLITWVLAIAAVAGFIGFLLFEGARAVFG